MSSSALCAALNSLIEDCTVILGWCFSSEDVDKTKLKQKEVGDLLQIDQAPWWQCSYTVL